MSSAHGSIPSILSVIGRGGSTEPAGMAPVGAGAGAPQPTNTTAPAATASTRTSHQEPGGGWPGHVFVDKQHPFHLRHDLQTLGLAVRLSTRLGGTDSDQV